MSANTQREKPLREIKGNVGNGEDTCESVMELVTLESLGNGENTFESVQTPRERSHWERSKEMLETEMIPARVLWVHQSGMELVTLKSLGNRDYTCERAKTERKKLYRN